MDKWRNVWITVHVFITLLYNQSNVWITVHVFITILYNQSNVWINVHVFITILYNKSFSKCTLNDQQYNDPYLLEGTFYL